MGRKYQFAPAGRRHPERVYGALGRLPGWMTAVPSSPVIAADEPPEVPMTASWPQL